MSWKQGSVDLTKWSTIFVLLWTLIEVKGNPCPYEGSNVPCICTRHAEDENARDQCDNWATAPFYRKAMASPIGLGELQIKSVDRDKVSQSNFNELGYCKLRQPGQVQHIPLGYFAGKNVSVAISHIYSHPHYGLVGVNVTTHARARFVTFTPTKP